MQKITVIGRLGRDASIRESQDGGSKFVTFTMAVNGRFRGVEKTSWYEVTAFNYDRYKNMVKYLTKGSSVIVVGELDAVVEEGKDGVARCRRIITADSIEFNSNGASGTTTSTQTSVSEETKKIMKDISSDDDEEEVSIKRKKKSEKVAEPEPVVEKVDDEEEDEEPGDLPF